jgi:hypothetical protein
MRRLIPLWIILGVTAVSVMVAPLSSAAPIGSQACNLRGSWVANTAETARYIGALNPTTTQIQVTSGALSATFDSGRLTVGAIGLKLTGRKGATRLKQEIDIEAVAPYRVAGSRLALGRGTYKLVYISSVITTSNGATVAVDLPNISTATPPSSVPYSCTPGTLRLRVSAGARGGVTLTMRRDRG